LSYRSPLNRETSTSTQSPSSDQQDYSVEQNPRFVAALCYARMGLHVLPIEPRSKKPLDGLGYKHGTTAESAIREWFGRCPDAGVGVALAPSGLVCVDIDPMNGGGEEGPPGAVPTTLTARTGGGGRHIIFRAAAGATYPRKLAQGIDIVHRGHIVVEPSEHPSGGQYAWQDWKICEGSPNIAEAPQWVSEARRCSLPVPVIDSVEDQRSGLDDAIS
jgi:hypothetical protein